MKAYAIPEGQKAAKGRAIINLLELSEGEKITSVIPVTSESEGYLIQSTKFAAIKKTDLKEFENIRKSGKIAISLAEGDELVSVQVTSGRDEILVATHDGKCIKFSEEEIRSLARDTKGVRSIRLAKGDYVVDMIAIKAGKNLITVSENGFGKRVDPEEYRLQTRGGKGTKAGIFNEKTGKLVNMKLVGDDEDIMLIASEGTIIRMRAKNIKKIGRGTSGVKMMRMKEGDRIVSVAIADAYAEDTNTDEVNDSMVIENDEV